MGTMSVADYGITTTYEDVEHLIRHTVRRFMRRYPCAGDFDDLVADANTIFMRAYRTYDEDNGKFTNWLGFLIYKILLEGVRRKAMRGARMKMEYAEMDLVGAMPKERFDLDEYAHGLSEDAKTVMRLTIDAPMEVLLSITQRGRQSPVAVKASLREYLKDLGWASSRVTESFSEITKALSQ